MPSSEESERAILGAILLDNSLIAQAVESLAAEDFYSPLHRRIFNAMTALFTASMRIDPILIGKPTGIVQYLWQEVFITQSLLNDFYWSMGGTIIAFVLGSIAGVLGAYLLLHPKARVLTLVPFFYMMRLIYLPAVLVLGLWFALQLFSIRLGQAPGGGVAFMAHIGGFLAGMILIWIFRRRRPPLRPE